MGAFSETKGVLARDGEHSVEAVMKITSPTILVQLSEVANDRSPTMCKAASFPSFETAPNIVENASRTSQMKASSASSSSVTSSERAR